MKILVDVDNVIADLSTEWLRRYNTDFDDNLTLNDIKSWDTHLYVKPECGMDIYSYLKDRDLYTDVLAIDGAISGILWLKRQGHDIVYVTAGIQESKARWMCDYGFTDEVLSPSNLIVAHNKYHIRGDLIIDDNPRNCDEFGGKAILFNQPWNESSQTNHFRAYGWPDVIQYIARKEYGINP